MQYLICTSDILCMWVCITWNSDYIDIATVVNFYLRSYYVDNCLNADENRRGCAGCSFMLSAGWQLAFTGGQNYLNWTSLKEILLARWSNQAGKFYLKTVQFARYRALNESPGYGSFIWAVPKFLPSLNGHLALHDHKLSLGICTLRLLYRLPNKKCMNIGNKMLQNLER